MVYMYHSSLIHLSADGHLGRFHVLAIINSIPFNHQNVDSHSPCLVYGLLVTCFHWTEWGGSETGISEVVLEKVIDLLLGFFSLEMISSGCQAVRKPRPHEKAIWRCSGWQLPPQPTWALNSSQEFSEVTPITRWSRENMFLLFPAHIVALEAKWIHCCHSIWGGSL